MIGVRRSRRRHYYYVDPRDRVREVLEFSKSIFLWSLPVMLLVVGLLDFFGAPR